MNILSAARRRTSHDPARVTRICFLHRSKSLQSGLGRAGSDIVPWAVVMLSILLAKMTIARRACVVLNGWLRLAVLPELRAGSITAANRDATALFAEPGELTPLGVTRASLSGTVSAKLKARLDLPVPLLGPGLCPAPPQNFWGVSADDQSAHGQAGLDRGPRSRVHACERATTSIEGRGRDDGSRQASVEGCRPPGRLPGLAAEAA